MEELVLGLCNNSCVFAVASVVAGLAVITVIAVLVYLLRVFFNIFRGCDVWMN